jgi:hypothetical protein
VRVSAWADSQHTLPVPADTHHATHLLSALQGFQVADVELGDGARPHAHAHRAWRRRVRLEQHDAQVLVHLSHQLLLTGLQSCLLVVRGTGRGAPVSAPRRHQQC